MKHHPVLASSAAALLGIPAASAESPIASMNRSILDETVVTATRTETRVFDAPYVVHVIDRRDFIDRRMVRTFPDVLLDTPGVMVQRTGYGQASPFIRGFTGFRTLALIDGIRLNNATFREGPNQYWSTIDPYSVERIDVVKGPSSVLYGSDAIGGTVNAITRKPPLLPWPDGKTAASRPEFHGSMDYRYASAGNSNTGRGEFSLAASPQFGIAGGFTYSNFDDLRAGRGTGSQDRSGYTQASGDVTAIWRPNKDTDVTFSYQGFQQNNAPRWHSTIFGKSWEGTTVGNDLQRDFDQNRHFGYARIETRDIADWLSKASLTLSIHSQREEQDRLVSNRRRDQDGFEDNQLGVLAAFESPSPIGLLSYGVEYYRDFVQSWGTSWNANGSLRSIKPRGQVADDSTYDLLGLYLQDEIKVGDRLVLIPGIRWTWAHLNAGTMDTNFSGSLALPGFDESFDAFTFSFRARYDILKEWNVFTGISQGFRAPNLSDFTSFDIARSGEIETPVTDLDPEQYLSLEIGTKVQTGKVGFYAAYYYTWIDDQITRYRTGARIDGAPEVKRTNSGDGHVQGVEAGVNWLFAPGWSAFGNFAWSEGEVQQFDGSVLGNYPASRIQPITVQLGVRWESPDAKWWAECFATLAAEQDRLSLSDTFDTQRIPPGGTPGYAVASLRAGWRPCKDFYLYVACENLTDKDYRIHGSGINEAGRNFVIATRISF